MFSVLCTAITMEYVVFLKVRSSSGFRERRGGEGGELHLWREATTIMDSLQLLQTPVSDFP